MKTASESFINSRWLPFGVRRLCVQTLVDRAGYLASLIADGQLRIIVSINPYDLWNSHLTVLNAKDISAFLHRNGPEQWWQPIEEKSLARMWTLHLPDGFSERQFAVEIRDEEKTFRGQLSIIGQLDRWEIAPTSACGR